MNIKRQSERGELITVLVIVAVVAIMAGLGYVLWKNMSESDKTSQNQTSQQAGTEDVAADETTYADLRKDAKDGTGVELKTVDDIAKLGLIGADLKAYFIDRVGKTVAAQAGDIIQQFTIDRVQGDYAVGQTNAVGSYVIWGPKDGGIDIVASTQNMGLSCDDLARAKVPSRLVDGSCMSMNGEGENMTHEMKAYKQD